MNIILHKQLLRRCCWG